MIRTYIRYSYGGYKNFLINGNSDEFLNQVTTVDNSYGLPDDAILLFNRGHVKMIFTSLQNQEYSLLVKGISSPHMDSDGRHIPFEIQFIGNDKTALSNLTIRIANNIKEFEEFLFDLFYERSGLYIKGDLLKKYIENSTNLTYTGNSELLNISRGSSKILFFVPLSQNFNLKSRATVCQETISRVLQDLQFGKNDFGETVIINYNDLLNIQNLLVVNVRPAKISEVSNVNIGHEEEKNINIEAINLSNEVKDLKCQLATEQKNYLSLKKENERLNKLNNKIKYVTYGLVGTSLLVLLMYIFKK